MDQKGLGKLKWAVFHGQKEVIDSLLEENTPVDNRAYHMQDFRPPLHSSVYLGDVSIVKRLLHKGASINVFDTNRETALILAAKLEKYAIVDLMLSEEIKNRSNEENLTHLHIACMRNRIDVVRKLVINETNINVSVNSKSIRWPGYTALHFAVQFQCTETVAFLLRLGADITIKNSNQLTALHLADMVRNEEMIDMILAAHKKVVKNPLNSEGLSHFHIACTRNNTEIVECFIKNGVALDESVHKTSLNWSNYTAIDFAILYDCVDVAELLLLRGDRKIFPSKCAGIDRVTNAYCSGNIQLVNLFLHRDEPKKMNSSDIQKLPALHHSCIYNDIDTIDQSLTEAPNSLNTLICQGSTPLHLAIERGDETIIVYLLNQGADYNVKNADGKTALHLAFERNIKTIVKQVLRNVNSSDVSIVDNNGFSYLHIACIENEVKAVKHFVKRDAGVIDAPVNFDSATWPGFTPLHFAAKFASPEVVRVLLENGASYVATDKYDQSAFDVAIFEFQYFEQENSIDLFHVMRLILSTHEKCKIDCFKDRGFSLLHVIYPLNGAVDLEEDDYRSDLRKFIREHPSDLNKTIHKLGMRWDGCTPLHFATDLNSDCTDLLVEMGADVWIKNAKGDTPMHLSCLHHVMPELPKGTIEFNELLHNPVAVHGESLFHVACKAGRKDWVEYYLNHGIDPNSRNTVPGLEFPDRTPLRLTTNFVGGPKFEIVKLLLQRGADARARDHHLNTPLHHMMGSVDAETIDLLVSHGVDVNARNTFLQTPLLSICANQQLYFSERELKVIVQSLLNHGADINLADERGVSVLSVDNWKSHYISQRFSIVIQVLIKHLIKLDAMGLNISESNKKAYSGMWQLFTLETKSSLVNFEMKCKKELELLMGVRTDIYTTLHDVLLKNLNELSVMCGNDKFRSIVQSDDFKKRFPIYGSMLKFQLRRGQERRPLIADATRVLKSLMNVSTPKECLECILQFLDNDDLRNLIMLDNHLQHSRQ